jgi:hypothetical protein
MRRDLFQTKYDLFRESVRPFVERSIAPLRAAGSLGTQVVKVFDLVAARTGSATTKPRRSRSAS